MGWLATRFVDQLGHVGRGEQRQSYLHAGSYAGVTSRWIVMPPGHAAAMHCHRDSVIVVSVICGHVTSVLVTVDGQLTTEEHRTGDVIIIDRGVLHLGINTSPDKPVVLSELGTTEHFHHDVRRYPEWDSAVDELADDLRDRFPQHDAPDTNVADLLVQHMLPRSTQALLCPLWIDTRVAPSAPGSLGSKPLGVRWQVSMNRAGSSGAGPGGRRGSCRSFDFVRARLHP